VSVGSRHTVVVVFLFWLHIFEHVGGVLTAVYALYNLLVIFVFLVFGLFLLVEVLNVIGLGLLLHCYRFLTLYIVFTDVLFHTSSFSACEDFVRSPWLLNNRLTVSHFNCVGLGFLFLSDRSELQIFFVRFLVPLKGLFRLLLEVVGVCQVLFGVVVGFILFTHLNDLEEV
jgi:hypothetical protein